MAELVFKRYGGSHQLKIQDAHDLGKIQTLNEALWAATSVPIDNLDCDRVFLSHVDMDKNGRIRTRELKEAQSWLYRMLAGRSHLSEGTDVLRLDDIDTSHVEGQELRKTAEFILNNLGVPQAKEISLQQVRDARSIIANAANNGDGVVPPEAVADADLAQFISSIMDTVGSTMDASNRPGVGKKELEDFFHTAETYLVWKEKGNVPAGKESTDVMPWGNDTPHLYQLVADLEEKIDQYFTQCAMVGFDERAAVQMQLRQKELEEIDFADPEVLRNRLMNAPLGKVDPEGMLDFTSAINTLYRERLLELRDKVFKRAIGEDVKQLTRQQWEKVKTIFAPYRAYVESKQGGAVEKLGDDSLRKYLQGQYRERVNELIDKDRSVADELSQILTAEKLILYQRWLLELANNFVSFANLYDPGIRALFEAGTLVIDGREIMFTMKVQDVQAHKIRSEKSYMCLLYLEVTGRQDREIAFNIVAPVTSSNIGELRVGKRGIFFSTDGCEWDAEVKDIVVNPISIWESVTAPCRQVSDFLKAQVDKLSKVREEKIQTTMAVPTTSGAARDLLLGGGIAIAALGSAFAYIIKALSQVKLSHVLGVLLGIIVIVILPGMIAGFVKIRRRDMSILLEASGWAINVRMRLSIALGRLFTHIPGLPKRARKEKRDSIGKFLKQFGYSSTFSRSFFIVVSIIVIVFLIFQLFMMR
ncbi:MAG: hypothetical protein DRP85_02660 [Candidatus Makaraimicrobium thalassicum]|nr:MAG: hypothetical protein DRP85_02660 [Candidatus Omnitrophota bacterium]